MAGMRRSTRFCTRWCINGKTKLATRSITGRSSVAKPVRSGLRRGRNGRLDEGDGGWATGDGRWAKSEKQKRTVKRRKGERQKAKGKRRRAKGGRRGSRQPVILRERERSDA